MQQLKKSLLPAARRLVQKTFSPEYLLYTNLATATITFIIGDGLEQRLEMLLQGGGKKWDVSRSVSMGAAGTLNGLIFHHWYAVLDKKLPGTGIQTVIKKIVADMLIGSNLSILGLFAVQALMERSSFQQFLEDYRAGWLPVYTSDLMLWPATQFVNFYFLPPRFRLLCVNIVTIVAAVLRSHISHDIQEAHHKKDEE